MVLISYAIYQEKIKILAWLCIRRRKSCHLLEIVDVFWYLFIKWMCYLNILSAFHQSSCFCGLCRSRSVCTKRASWFLIYAVRFAETQKTKATMKLQLLGWHFLQWKLLLALFSALTLSQTTNSRLFQTERVCKQQFQIWWKWWKVLWRGRKHCGKRRNCSSRAISSFPTVFSKDLYCRHVKTRTCVGKG